MTYEQLFKIIKWVGIVFIVLFGAPIIGTLSAFGLAEIAGCPLSAANSVDCYFLGLNIGQRLYGYAVPLVGSIMTPIALFSAFKDILLIWLAMLIWTWYLHKNNSSDAD